MNRFDPQLPRTVFALAGFALTMLTLMLAVVVPAMLAPAGTDVSTQVAATPKTPHEVAINPSRIDVIGIRTREVAAGNSPQGTRARPRG